MANAKNAIALLCKHLNFLFDLELNPEMFRLAKFNKSDENIIEKYWKCLSIFGDCGVTGNVDGVKDYLKKIGYNDFKFYDLSVDTVDTRELLFALCFVLSKGELDNAVKRKCENSLFHFDETSCIQKNDFNFPTNLFINENVLDQSSRWVKGKINYNKRIAEEYNLSINNIFKKFDKVSTFNFNICLPQLRALNDKNFASKFLNNTKWIVQVLDNHDQWLRKEPLFWEWMNSVVAEKQKESDNKNLHNV